MIEIAIQVFQWSGAVLILSGLYKIESKWVHAPLVIMIGALCMLTFGLLIQAGGVILVNSVAFILNYRCWRKWIRDETHNKKYSPGRVDISNESS